MKDWHLETRARSIFFQRPNQVILFSIVLFMASKTVFAEPLPVGKFPQETSEFFPMKPQADAKDFQSIEINSTDQVFVETKEGWFLLSERQWLKKALPRAIQKSRRIPRKLLLSTQAGINQSSQLPDRRWLAATNEGLLIETEGELVRWPVFDNKGRQWGTHDIKGVKVDQKGQIWFTSLAGVACRTSKGWQFFEGKDGLPYNDFTRIASGPDGEIWFGTKKGLIRYQDGRWDYRQGKRWLPDDMIIDLKVDSVGTVWVLTPEGIGCIRKDSITLAEKAAFYEEEIKSYIKRTPLGYLSEVSVNTPGKRDHIHYHDSDNDGLWTSMYGAGECFAFAATKDPETKERAQQAFKALQFLQTVTQEGSHPAPKGFVARTIRSTKLPDPNDGRLKQDKEIQKNRDQLWKTYEPRWPVSADGKWYWKSDTSSDELDGHYFFYPLYYDLVAQTEKEKEEVRQVVRDLTDHLIAHGYNLVDHTGTVTRWGVYSPDALNHDPDWWAERGLKSLSMLSYLAVAAHVTGDSKYLEHQAELIQNHAFDTNALIYKIHRGIGSGNQSDDEMAFMCYYNLLRYTPEGPLRQKALLSFYAAWLNEAPEMNPFFHFAYAGQAMGREVSDPWGTHSISPTGDWLVDSVETLQGFPLDRFNWACENSHRIDIRTLPDQNSTDLLSSSPRRRGYRINGKVLPVENRHFNHWNTDPWQLDYGGSGHILASGTVFLLPYYMGLYHGFIAP